MPLSKLSDCSLDAPSIDPPTKLPTLIIVSVGSLDIEHAKIILVKALKIPFSNYIKIYHYPAHAFNSIHFLDYGKIKYHSS